MKEDFSDNSYSLLRAMYHTKIAMEYFEDVANGYEASAKHLMKSYALKCGWILDNIKHRLPQETIDSINTDMRDSLFLDAIEEKIIHFNDKQRESLEVIVDMMYNGTPVEVKFSQPKEEFEDD